MSNNNKSASSKRIIAMNNAGSPEAHGPLFSEYKPLVVLVLYVDGSWFNSNLTRLGLFLVGLHGL